MPNYTETKTRLIINKLSREKYDYLVSNDLISENELYLVKDTNLDAVSARLINVGDPISATDGANKQYVDETIEDLTSAFVPISGIATSSTAGIVKPDNSTITVNASGVISANIPTVPIATDSIPGIVKPDGSTITIDASGMIKTNHSYVFNTPIQTTSTTDETDDTISVELANRAINIVPLATTVKYLGVTFPQITTGYARDFFVRLVITGDVPTISFSEYGGGLPDFDIADDAWSNMEQGANVIMFTETSQP